MFANVASASAWAVVARENVVELIAERLEAQVGVGVEKREWLG